jgi:uncharacterized protein
MTPNVVPDASPAPVAPEERIDLVDALRGVALLGILLVNIAWFTQPFATEFLPPSESLTTLDRIADAAVRFVAETKFYSMFSLLFGFGMAIQMGRAELRGASFVPLFLRRRLALFVIGILHVVLMWYGDILHGYAILGCVLLLFRNCRPRTVVVWLVVFMLAPVLLFTGLTALALFAQRLGADQGWATEGMPAAVSTSPAPDSQATQPTLSPGSAPADDDNPFASEEAWVGFMSQWAQRETAVFRSGTFAEQVQLRLENFVWSALMLGLLYPNILGLFLGGVWIARRGVFHAPGQHLDWLRRAALLGLAVGIPLNIAYAWIVFRSFSDQGGTLMLAAVAIGFLAGPALMLGYVASLSLWWQTSVGRACLTPFTFVGRMALTNYLLQSFICTSIFYSRGMGWFGQVGPAQAVGVALLVYAFQIPISHLWLKRFPFGPMEWLWRSFTYGRRISMRHG